MPSILHVTESYAGGVVAAVRDYVASTPAFAHHLLFADRPDAPVDSSSFVGFHTVTRLPPGNIARIRRIRSTTRNLAPQAVHAHSSFAGAYTRLALNARRRRVVYTPHCYAFERADVNPLTSLAFKTVEHLLSFNTTVFAACSPREAALSNWRGCKASVLFVPNLPPSGDLQRARRTGTSHERLRLVGAGRASAQKDPTFFLRCVEYAHRAGLPIQATWIGSDPGFGDAGRALDIDVTGWLSRDEALTTLAENDIYLHTGLWEGFPLAVLEALDVGVAAVVRDVPAFAGVDLPKVATETDFVRLLGDAGSEADIAQLWTQGVHSLRDNTRINQLSALHRVYGGRNVGH
ncbi:glycosyltransferase [Microbacterium sp. ABRD28]|uniref:glycosyltransferase n=1 Tax=Microbacterium sp. ABRD28 TaxID=2268461 RepID=UPI0013DDF126|nr:glycosyltransferase [Microbacterium sp. ABRD28]